jgi:hypothetical protein
MANSVIKVHLIICGLFSDSLSRSGYVVLNEGVVNELERIWEELVIT